MSHQEERTTLKIRPPENCPSCDYTLIWVKDQLYCKNSECQSQSLKKVEHFAKTMKIRGLGPSSIEKLNIFDITDIYALTPEYMSRQLNSEKTAIKVFDEIKRSENETLDTVLPAFGIPLVGKTATAKLAKVASSIFDIDEALCLQVQLGPKTTENLMNWIDNDFFKYQDLPLNFEFSKDTRPAGKRGVVCISGKLNSYPTKAAAKAVLEGLGYTVKDSLTKEVTILVNESGIETAKTRKAAESGVQIVNNLKTYMENI